MSKRKKSLAEEIAALNDPTPKDYDPEDAGKTEGFEEDQWDEAEPVAPAKGKARKVGEVGRMRSGIGSMGAKYSGKTATRRDLVDEEDEEEIMAMDESGESDEDDCASDDALDDDGDLMDGEVRGGAGADDDDFERELADLQAQESKMVQTLTGSQDAEMQKAMHTRNQRTLYDNFLEMRIKLQQGLTAANRLPLGDMQAAWCKQNKEVAAAVVETRAELDALLATLWELKRAMVGQNSVFESARDAVGERPQGATADAWWSVLEPAEQSCQAPMNETIEKWNRRTQLGAGLPLKKLKAINKTITSQIEDVLNDRDRLVKRTQLRRSEFTILGQEPDDGKSRMGTWTEEVFDDTDFFELLLREVIEGGVASTDDPVEMSRRWLKLKQMKAKKHKDVDRRASKGRKVRYDVQPKLVSFMTPVEPLEDKGADFFSGLFGYTLTKEEQMAGESDDEEDATVAAPAAAGEAVARVGAGERVGKRTEADEDDGDEEDDEDDEDDEADEADAAADSDDDMDL